MRGSTGPESSSPTLVGIRASIRCSSGFLSAARICSLWEKNQNTSITATTAPKNITMVINQIICAGTQTDDSAEPTARGPSFTELNCTSVIGRSKITSFPNPYFVPSLEFVRLPLCVLRLLLSLGPNFGVTAMRRPLQANRPGREGLRAPALWFRTLRTNCDPRTPRCC